ncbi:MAG: hypothetical protein HXN77_08965 [Prevotella pallens]|uniref:hypothetical protein n=1 Tax=Prevotella pallens TaxID=60133 RepID=UPI001CB05047|nr:hypothetical protein [Prevotella pallens]MBF1490613.1 hypothetical protein [Prevotella pallens]
METVLLGQGGEHQDGVVRINYKSDFPLEVKVVRNGVAENFPDADFTLTAKTEGGFTVYKAERKAGVYSHCKRDGERLIMFFDNHGLAKGRLIVSAVINHPDADYTEDGIRQENLTTTTNIELVEDNGDALQLQLPEPRVVEKVVEKIVEKETDHYNDLQKKAAAWVAGIDTSNDPVYPLILDYFLKNITDVKSLPTTFQESYLNGTNETDSDFNEKMQLASEYARVVAIKSKNISYLYSSINAPNYDLSINIDDELLNIDGLFAQSIFKTITINHGAGMQYSPSLNSDFLSSIGSKNIDDVINSIATSEIFKTTKAEKVTINIAPYSNGQGIDGGWYMLAGIGGSMVDTFDVGYTSPKQVGDISIDFVAEKILPDVSQDEHKPNLIFRNVVGTVNEELKQKILAKGYSSVEFYEGENKVL